MVSEPGVSMEVRVLASVSPAPPEGVKMRCDPAKLGEGNRLDGRKKRWAVIGRSKR